MTEAKITKISNPNSAIILHRQEIEQLFSEGFQSQRDRALFGTCLYTGCKISEACSMLAADAYDKSRVREQLRIRKSKPAQKETTRSIPTHPRLVELLDIYHPLAGEIYLFPGRHGRGHINPKAAALILKQACERVGLIGITTHTFRRTALITLSKAGIPLQTLQIISGIESLAALQRYLTETDISVSAAIASLKF